MAKKTEKGKIKLKPNALAITLAILAVGIILVYFMDKSSGMFINSNESLTLKSKTDRNEDILMDDDAVMGRKNATIIIAEFGDFMCKFCGEVHRKIEPLWRKEYIEAGKARYVFRDFISPDHPQAYPAAEASECADVQNRQWQMYDLLFSNAYTGDAWAKIEDKEKLNGIFKKYAAEIGLNAGQFNACMSNNYFAKEIMDDISAGVIGGVSGTPTIFIGNDKTGIVKIKGAQPYSVYKQIIDEKLDSGRTGGK